MRKIFTTLACVFVCLNIHLFAQTTDSVLTRPLQITFIYPLGTNGIESAKYTNHLSYNIIAGYNYGLQGIEIGGFANTLKNDMEGIQISGFSNIVLGKTTGIQISGFSNYTNKITQGIQVSGYSNIVNDSAMVMQFSGFSNVVNGTTLGIQASGFSNVSVKDLKGSQFSGFCNVVKGSMWGCQIAGFANVTTDSATVIQGAGFSNIVHGKTKGIQIAGFTNAATNDLEGIQASGFANIVKGNITGCQIAGFANICSQDLTGAQLSGFINVTKKLKGLQLGFINVCDTVEQGIPIGFLSFVNKGYHAFEISVNESSFVNASLITGVPKFYNIFSVGARAKNDTIILSYGYGVGTRIPINEKINLAVELETKAISVDWMYNNINSISTGSLQASYTFHTNMELFGGINYNVFVTNQTNAEGKFTDSGIVPWSNFNREYSDVLVKMYPGANIGVRICNIN